MTAVSCSSWGLNFEGGSTCVPNICNIVSDFVAEPAPGYSATFWFHNRCNTQGGVISTHDQWGCAILTKKVAPKNPGTYLKLRPKNPGARNATRSFCMRKLTAQIRKSLISTPHFSFTYFIKGFYYLTFVYDVCAGRF